MPVPQQLHEKLRPTKGPFAFTREKLAQHAIKRPFWAILSTQGELFRAHPHIRPRRANFFAHRAQHSATVKPPSPLLAPEQQPLKPTTPLRPKNAPKTPVSHPQRRWRFQSHTGTITERRQGFQSDAHKREQRRWRFQMRLGMGEQRRCRFQLRLALLAQRRRRYPTTAWPVCGLRLRHQQVPMCPLLRKLACNSMTRTFKNNQKR